MPLDMKLEDIDGSVYLPPNDEAGAIHPPSQLQF
jgi:hypothetical protein